MTRQDRVKDAFAACRAEGRAAFVAYVMAGDPDPDASVAAALACVEGGADLLELGVPFSDPIADGPTIQKAALRALQAGATVATCLDVARRVRERARVPVVLMGYLNPILAFGEGAFFTACARAGVDAVLVPDLPPEHAGPLWPHARAEGVHLPFLLSPTSTDERIASVSAAATGFVYYVSVTGVTGARAELPADLAERLALVREKSPVPVIAGFGLSTAAQVAEVGRRADGVVVGSAIVARVAEGGGPDAIAARVRDYVRELRAGLGGGR
ncbi:MAG TPA: tryptophan synthase subunit alpha [Polyangiaceae bacterium]|nr:tryptophan synthase subunit alpha [Polyangiaceae bacterium]